MKLLIIVCVILSLLPIRDARLLGPGAPRPVGGFLFRDNSRHADMDAEEDQQTGDHVQTGPPYSLFSARSSDKDAQEASQQGGKLRLGPILLDPQHLVYDDNDEYREEEQGATTRPNVGIDLFFFFSPMTNFLSVLWKVLSNFLLKLEKQFYRLMGKEHSESHMGLLIVVSLIWLFFGLFVVVINYIVNRLLAVDTVEPCLTAEMPFGVAQVMPSLLTTPPTPTPAEESDLQPEDLDGSLPKRRKVEIRDSSHAHDAPATPNVAPWLSCIGVLPVCKSVILRSREKLRVEQLLSNATILGQFHQRICDESVTSETIQLIDDALLQIFYNQFNRARFVDILISKLNSKVKAVQLEVAALEDVSICAKDNVHMKWLTSSRLWIQFQVEAKFELYLLVNSVPSGGELSPDEQRVGQLLSDGMAVLIEVVADYCNEDNKDVTLFGFHNLTITITSQTGVIKQQPRLRWLQPTDAQNFAEELKPAIEETFGKCLTIDVTLQDLLDEPALLHRGPRRPGSQEEDDVSEEMLLELSVVKLVCGQCNYLPRNPCVHLEVDRPSQVFCTGIHDAIRAADSGEFRWQKNHTLSLKIQRKETLEILLEVWNAGEEDEFLGLCVFSVPDLLCTTPSQTQIVTIQARPFEQFGCASEITIHIDFKMKSTLEEDVSILSSSSYFKGVHKVAESRRISLINGQTNRFSTTTYFIDVSAFKKEETSEDGSDIRTLQHIHRSNTVAQAALLDLQCHQSITQKKAVNRSTLFIRSIQKMEEKSVEECRNEAVPDSVAPEQVEPPCEASSQQQQAEADEAEGCSSSQSGEAPSIRIEEVSLNSSPEAVSKPIKKGIMSSLKEKLVGKRSKPQKIATPFRPKKSLERIQDEKPEREGSSCDAWTIDDSGSSCSSSCSSQNSFKPQGWQGVLSVSWQSLNSDGSCVHGSFLTPASVLDDASSLSEASGFSVTSISCKSGLNEDVSSFNSDSATSNSAVVASSALVLETLEHGLKRHYLIPIQFVKKKAYKLKLKGLKLHICMDHVFVARHIKGSPKCAVCRSRILARIGKQGYVCRDCELVCHKACHVKVRSQCSKSSFKAMELFRGSTIMKKKD